MLEEQEARKREAGFDRIEIIAKMHAQRLHTGFGSKLLFKRLYNLRWSHSPEECKLEMDVKVERLRLEFFSQPAPAPQCNSSPRRSPAVGTGSDEPGVPRAETQQATKQDGIFLIQVRVDGFLYVDCTKSLDPEGTNLLEADIGVNPESTTASTSRSSRGVCETVD